MICGVHNYYQNILLLTNYNAISQFSKKNLNNSK